MSDKDLLKIDTRGICLLCYNPDTLDSNSVATPELTANAFKQLLRYIEVKSCDLFGSLTETFHLMDMDKEHEVNVQASMCSRCSSNLQEFGHLYESYVLTMIQMDNCVNNVARLIKAANESPKENQHFQEKMKPTGFADLVNFNFASKLRSLALEKCVKKLQLNSKDVLMTDVESLIPAQNNQLDQANIQSSSSTLPSSFSEVNNTDELTSQVNIEPENGTDGIPAHQQNQLSILKPQQNMIMGAPGNQLGRTNNQTYILPPSLPEVLDTNEQTTQGGSGQDIDDNELRGRAATLHDASAKLVKKKRPPFIKIKTDLRATKKAKRVKCPTCDKELSHHSLKRQRHIKRCNMPILENSSDNHYDSSQYGHSSSLYHTTFENVDSQSAEETEHANDNVPVLNDESNPPYMDQERTVDRFAKRKYRRYKANPGAGQRASKKAKSDICKKQKIKNHVCITCGKAFVGIRWLKKHKLSHVRVKKEMGPSNAHKCNICYKQHYSLSSLDRHMSLVHGNDNDASARWIQKLQDWTGYLQYTDSDVETLQDVRVEPLTSEELMEQERQQPGTQNEQSNGNVAENGRSLVYSNCPNSEYVDHDEENTYLCIYCPLWFTGLQQLIAHRQNVHMN